MLLLSCLSCNGLCRLLPSLSTIFWTLKGISSTLPTARASNGPGGTEHINKGFGSSWPASTHKGGGGRRHTVIQGLSLRTHQSIVLFMSWVQGTQDNATQRLPLGERPTATHRPRESRNTLVHKDFTLQTDNSEVTAAWSLPGTGSLVDADSASTTESWQHTPATGETGSSVHDLCNILHYTEFVGRSVTTIHPVVQTKLLYN